MILIICFCYIEELLSSGSFEIMDYTEGSPVGEPIIKSLTDNPNYPYKIKCQQYTNEGKHKKAIKDSTVYSGLIMYWNDATEQYQVIDRFFLDSCPTEDVGIYVRDVSSDYPNGMIPAIKVFLILFKEKVESVSLGRSNRLPVNIKQLLRLVAKQLL